MLIIKAGRNDEANATCGQRRRQEWLYGSVHAHISHTFLHRQLRRLACRFVPKWRGGRVHDGPQTDGGRREEEDTRRWRVRHDSPS